MDFGLTIMIMKMMPGDYRSQIFPITASGEPLLVTVNVTILAFPEIHTLEVMMMMIMIMMIMITPWSSPTQWTSSC